MTSLLAIEYYLAKLLPKGAAVQVLFPKKVLSELLPKLAIERNLKVSVIGGTQGLRQALINQGSFIAQDNPIDLFITEPKAIGKDGAWVDPSESASLAGLDLIAVGSVLQWLSHTPADQDLISILSVVSEKGIFSADNLSEELSILTS